MIDKRKSIFVHNLSLKKRMRVIRSAFFTILIFLAPELALAACTWYDTGDPANANGSIDQGSPSNTFIANDLLSLPAGTVSKVRAFVDLSTFCQGMKVALYTSSSNYVIGGSGNGTCGSDLWQEFAVSETSISAGTYKMAVKSADNNTSHYWATITGQPSGSSYLNFDCAYADFPTGGACNPMGASDTDYTQKLIVGVCLDPFRIALSRPANNLGLIGYFSLNEGSSTVVGDSSGNGRIGTFTNSPDWVSGKNGKALSFDGNADNVYFSGSSFNFSIPSGGGMTASAWIKTTDDFGQVISFRNSLNASSIFDLAIGYNGATTNSGHFIPIMFYDNSSGLVEVISSVRIDDGQWHHVASVIDQANNLLKAYVDGVEYSVGQAVDGILTFGNGDIAIGHELNWTNTSYGNTDQRYLEGIIDEVRVYNRALTALEIAGLAKSKVSVVGGGEKKKVTSGLVGHWTFNGNDVNWSSATAGTVYDRSGQGNNGTINGLNQSSSPVRGKIGQAMNFDGSDDYIGFGTPLNSDNVSIFMWVKPNTWSTQWTTLISNQVGSSPYGGFDIRKKNAGAGDTTLEVAISVGSTDYVADAGSINTGVWQLVGFTYDGETLITYLNGAQVASEPAPSGSLRNSTENANLGRNPTFSGRYFDGSIDDARIFSRALSSAEIDQLYKLGSGAMIRRN